MTHVELFAGIGGIGIAAEWAGFRTVAQVERDPYCLKILEKHWPGVHRCREIRDFPDRDYRAVTLVSGGPPCQPSSTAGKRGGRDDDRWLWPEFARVVERLLPAWVLAENPLGILSLENGLAIEEWIARLEAKDYAFLPPLVYPIAALGADHRRYRVFFVAHLGCIGNDQREINKVRSKTSEDAATEIPVAHPDGVGRRQCGGAECESPDAEQDCETFTHLDGEHGDISGYGAGSLCGERPKTTKLRDGEIIADPDGQFLRHQSGRGYGTGRQDATITTNNGEIVTHPESGRREKFGISEGQGAERQGEIDAARTREVATDVDQQGRAYIQGIAGSPKAYRSRAIDPCSWWDTRSRLLRMVHGVRRPMDGRRIKALGNSCSPQQIYPILQAIAEVER